MKYFSNFSKIFNYKKLESKEKKKKNFDFLLSPSISSTRTKRFKTNKIFVEENSSRSLQIPTNEPMASSLPPKEEVSISLDKSKNGFLDSSIQSPEQSFTLNPNEKTTYDEIIEVNGMRGKENIKTRNSLRNTTKPNGVMNTSKSPNPIIDLKTKLNNETVLYITPNSAKPIAKSSKFRKGLKKNNNEIIASSVSFDLSIVDKSTQKLGDLEETKVDMNSSSIRKIKTLSTTKNRSGEKKAKSLIEPSYFNLISCTKNSGTKLKKKELVMDKTSEMVSIQRFTEKIGIYFNRKAKNEVIKVENVGENPLDWRLNNDYRDHAALKVIAAHWTGLMRSFYCLHKDFGHNNIFKSYFIIFDLFRQILFSVCVVCFYDDAFIGMAFVNVINISYFIVLAFLRPFRERIDQIQNLINEILVLLIGVSIFYMAFMEKFNFPNPEITLKLGWTIVFTNAMLIVIFMMRMILNFSKFGFLLLKLIYTIVKLKCVKINKVENMDPANKKSEDKEKKADVLQQFIEIQNFLS